jgi:hypothetical protein
MTSFDFEILAIPSGAPSHPATHFARTKKIWNEAKARSHLTFKIFQSGFLRIFSVWEKGNYRHGTAPLRAISKGSRERRRLGLRESEQNCSAGTFNGAAFFS